MQEQDVIVIGAGVNGLVCAAYLARAGHSVIVLDSAPDSAASMDSGWLSAQGHWFPNIRDRYCQLDGDIFRDLKLASHGVALAAHGLSLSFFTDGRTFVRHASGQPMKRLLERSAPADGERYGEYIDFVRRGYKNDPSFKLRSAQEVVEAFFVSPALRDHLIQSCLGSGLCEMGLAPSESTSALALLNDPLILADPSDSNNDVVAGQYRETPPSLDGALRSAVTKFGGVIRTDSPVTHIHSRNKKVTGVEIEGHGTLSARWVVSALDLKKTVFELLEPTIFETQHINRLRTLRSRGSIAQVNLELDGMPEVPVSGELNGHKVETVHVSGGLDKICIAAEEWKTGIVSEHVPVEVNFLPPKVASRSPSELVMATAYVYYVPAHPTLGAWDEAARYALGTRILDTISFAIPSFASHVRNIETITPDLFEVEKGMTGGHLQGVETALDMTRLPRSSDTNPQNVRLIDGLVMCGAGSSEVSYATGIAGRRAASRIHFGRGGEDRL